MGKAWSEKEQSMLVKKGLFGKEPYFCSLDSDFVDLRNPLKNN